MDPYRGFFRSTRLSQSRPTPSVPVPPSKVRKTMLPARYVIQAATRPVQTKTRAKTQAKTREIHFSPAGRRLQDRPARIVALYKTFSGPEFVEASLASVYPHVDGIVMVHSQTGWDASSGNTVVDRARAWSQQNDPAGKVHHLPSSLSEQPAQYAEGLKAARRLFDPDFIMLVDTDEVWEPSQLAQAVQRVAADREHCRFTCCMRTYVKSPLYLVRPAERCCPTIFLRNVPDLVIHGPRGNQVGPTLKWQDLYFHHFTYVRQDEASVFAKIRTSAIGDIASNVDLDAWRRDKWDQLPFAVNLNTTVGYESSWARVVPVSRLDMPLALQDHPLILNATNDRNASLAATVRPVSIIVPTCQPREQVKPLLDEIARRSTSVIAGQGQVVATCHNCSAAVNRNIGLDQAVNDLVIMLDDDIADLPMGWDQRLAASLENMPHAAMVSARLMAPGGNVGYLMGDASLVVGQMTRAAGRKLPTACVAFRKSELRFDEQFIGSGFEDDDFCRNLAVQDPQASFWVDNGVMVTHLNEMKNQKGENWKKNEAYFKKKWSSR